MSDHLCIAGSYKPGDPRPQGYNAVHEWARAQLKAGLRQHKCKWCGLWTFDHEACCDRKGKP